ncbi:MAG: hypothetical protein V5A58_09925 [Salinibacter sp.]|uniref:hypothetical protein n=1 Tax=Salinibacter sp. TaxID=2065818 RepID=UPI002FC3BAFF
MRLPCYTMVVLCALLAVGAGTAGAQNNRFTERSFVPSPSVRAFGDAGVALSGPDRPFFYNPAHLPRISSYFTVVGMQAAASQNLRDQVRFFNDRLRPAIEANFELEAEALESLYRDAERQGRRPVRGTGAVVVPSFVYSTSGIGIGGGLFAKTSLNYRLDDAGLGVPEAYLLSRTDVMAVLALGFDLEAVGLPGASVGGTVTRARRFLSFENKPLDAFAPDETALLFRGSTIQVDLGGLYTLPWWPFAGRFSVGGAVYDLLDSRYEYTYGGAPQIPFLDGFVAEPGSVEPGSADREATRARRLFRLRPSYRVGVAYRLASASVFDDVAVAADYQGYGTDRQHPLARVHLGARAEVVEGVTLRAGLSAGYPTGGLGLQFGAVHLDYAVHAFEEGRAPGQAGTYVQTARLMLRIQ